MKAAEGQQKMQIRDIIIIITIIIIVVVVVVVVVAVAVVIIIIIIYGICSILQIYTIYIHKHYQSSHRHHYYSLF